MGITKSNDLGQLVITKGSVSTAADATNVITVGNVQVAGVSYANGAAINALDADAFTDIQDINLGVPFLLQFGTNASGYMGTIALDAETAGDYLRLQYERDGIAILDITVGPSKTQNVIMPYSSEFAASANQKAALMLVKSRFRVRLYKHGTIDVVASVASFGPLNYYDATL